MNMIHIIILVFFFGIYFYWRLPKENSIRNWIDQHSIGIGNTFLVFWILFFLARSPRTALYFGVPMLIIGGVLYYGKRRRLREYHDNGAPHEFSSHQRSSNKKGDPNNLGDPREYKK